MKSISNYLAACAVLAFTFSPALHAQYEAQQPPPPTDAGPQDQGDDQGASFQQFYDQLGDQGSWVQTDDYGYVFQPNVQDPNWAPYSDGHWANTDAGWMWVSDEPWGWATYHYGRWANIDGMGWAWVPGYQWAPAWVSWRYGGGYCGWAPLPPETFIGAEYAQPGFAVGVGFHFGGDVDVSFNIGPGCYNFVRVGDFGERNYRGRYLDRSRNYTVINNTTNITNINVNKTVINNGSAGNNFRGVAVGGPPLNEVNAHSRTRIQTLRLAQANQPGRAAQNGDTLSVYAPRVNAASAHQARPARVAQTLSHPKLNRGDSITQPMQVTSSIQGHAASQEDIQSAQTAAAHAPAHAKVANEHTQAHTQFTQPLTTLQPVSPAATHQERAQANREANQQRALEQKDNRINQAEADKTANQDRAQQQKENRINQAEADKTANQDRAQQQKENRINQAEANKTANQEHAQQVKTDRTQTATEDQAANQERAQQAKQAREQAAQEHAARLQQQQADRQQVQSTHQQSSQDAAQARADRAAAAEQARQQHAAALQQQHAAAQQQQQQPAAPAHGPVNKDKDKDANNGQGQQQGH